MSTNTLLPAEFEALEPFAESWSVAGAWNREQRRSASNEPERIAFYHAAKDLLAPALAYLDQKSLKEFGDQEQRLMHLLLCFAHIAQAVEVQEGNEAAHRYLRERLLLTQASSDF